MTIKEYVKDVLGKFATKIKKMYVPRSGTGDTDELRISGDIVVSNGVSLAANNGDYSYSTVSPGSNLWIGAKGASFPAHKGRLILTTGPDETRIYMSKTKADNTGNEYAKKLIHEGDMQDLLKVISIQKTITVNAGVVATATSAAVTIPDGYTAVYPFFYGIGNGSGSNASNVLLSTLTWDATNKKLTWSYKNIGTAAATNVNLYSKLLCVRSTFD